MIEVRWAWLEGADRALGLPAYQSPGAAGADIRANFGEGGGAATLAPGTRALIPTGLSLAIPPGYELQLRPRSGLALKHGISIPNAPATIDSDYRGPLGVILINLGDRPFDVTHGDRIAQCVFAPVVQPQFEIVDTLDSTERGSGGFGSTGVSG